MNVVADWSSYRPYQIAGLHGSFGLDVHPDGQRELSFSELAFVSGALAWFWYAGGAAAGALKAALAGGDARDIAAGAASGAAAVWLIGKLKAKGL